MTGDGGVLKTKPHIVKTRPKLVEKVWGGSRLQDLCAKQGAQAPVGEAWEVADLDEGQSLVASGVYEGWRLRQLVELWDADLLGDSGDPKEPFPLLVKLLDARRDLSVQVHPRPQDLNGLESGSRSKWETWIIVEAGEGAAVIHGLRESMSPEDFREAATTGDLEACLRRVPVRKGDVITVAPGTIHAIGGQVVLLEIQQPSDTTYRVYDYQRPGLDGKPRQLHLDEALQVGRLEATEAIFNHRGPWTKRREKVAGTPAYSIERLKGDQGEVLRWSPASSTPQMLHVLDGRLRVDDGIGGTLELERFETALVPACVASITAEVRGGPVQVVGAVPGQREVFEALEVIKPSAASVVV